MDAFLTSAYGIEEENTFSDFNFYPNPCYDGLLNFEFKSPANPCEVKIFDLNGKLINHHTMTGEVKSSIQLNLVPGIYFIGMDDGKNTEVRKLIVN